ncbi:MAG: hypothetical protein AAF800_04045 [Planctomycetota bacterium]
MKAALAYVLAAALGGCQAYTSTPRATLDAPLPPQVAAAHAAPAFGVGDELGWLAFGDLALAPLPGEPRDVLVIAAAEPNAPDFDWLGRYLALAY